MRFFLYVLFSFLAFRGAALGDDSSADAPSPLTLWYNKPATLTPGRNEAGGTYRTMIHQAMPIGNGRLGVLVKGDVSHELLALSENTLWTGGLNPTGMYTTLGTFQTLGRVFIDLEGQESFSGYRRSLDVGDAIAHTTYTVNGVTYRRDYFCSYPDQVAVVRLTADQPGSYSGSVRYVDSHEGVATIKDNLITDASTLGDFSDLKYETQVLVLNDGGSRQVHHDEYGDQIDFKNCTSLTLLIAAGTNYAMDFAKHYRGAAPHDKVTLELAAASLQPYEKLRADHVADYQKFFVRCSLDFGASSAAQRAMPTDLRYKKAARETDPELEALMFQYGRYLLIAASRPGGVAANSQGVWNDSNYVVFGARYTNDLTSEMPYWPAETANLSECHLPLFTFLLSQIPGWKEATDKDPEFTLAPGTPPSPGFAIRGSSNIMGGMAFWWDKAAAAWYCHQFWDHYAFTQDKEFLAKVAYPVMKEVCEFNDAHLKTLPNGRLVVPHAWSPEHGPCTDGPSYDQENVWDLFNNYVQACDVLGIDRKYRDRIAGLRDRLLVPGIGSWGQLLEWATDMKGKNPNGDNNYEGINFKGLDTPADHHRHTSHLWGLYPGSQLTPEKNPALAKAAEISLIARGNTNNEWNYAWRCALYARLLDAERAYAQLRGFLAVGTAPNLMAAGGTIVQFDGNSGLVAGMAEMLLQSQEGYIQALPALPKEWPHGTVKGLRARGGFEVDESWDAGKLTSLTLHNIAGHAVEIRYGDKSAKVDIAPGSAAILDGNLKPDKS